MPLRAQPFPSLNTHTHTRTHTHTHAHTHTGYTKGEYYAAMERVHSSLPAAWGQVVATKLVAKEIGADWGEAWELECVD